MKQIAYKQMGADLEAGHVDHTVMGRILGARLDMNPNRPVGHTLVDIEPAARDEQHITAYVLDNLISKR